MKWISKYIPKTFLGSASLLAAVYMGFSPRVAKRMYNKMLFCPYPYPEGDYDSGHIGGLKYTDVFFRSLDDTQLHGWYFEQAGSKHTILVSHGNTGNIAGRSMLLEHILKTGSSLFIYDYRGYGRSQGKISLPGIIQDACAAFDYLHKEIGLTNKEIVLYGESLGGAITCQLSTHRKSAGMILQSAFTSLPKIGKEHVPFINLYPSFLFPKPTLNNVALLEEGHPPLLILHGCKDLVVPYEHGKELYKAASQIKYLKLFPKAGHSDIPFVAPEEFVDSIKQFLWEL